MGVEKKHPRVSGYRVPNVPMQKSVFYALLIFKHFFMLSFPKNKKKVF